MSFWLGQKLNKKESLKDWFRVGICVKVNVKSFDDSGAWTAHMNCLAHIAKFLGPDQILKLRL